MYNFIFWYHDRKKLGKRTGCSCLKKKKIASICKSQRGIVGVASVLWRLSPDCNMLTVFLLYIMNAIDWFDIIWWMRIVIGSAQSERNRWNTTIRFILNMESKFLFHWIFVCVHISFYSLVSRATVFVVNFQTSDCWWESQTDMV